MTTTQSALVIYYSRSGHTDRLASKIATKLDAETVRLRVNRYHWPYLGYMRAARDSLRGDLPTLTTDLPDLARYDIVALGSPVWTSYPATPLRALLAQRPHLPPCTGLFLTSGSHSPPEAAHDMARDLLGRPFAAWMNLGNSGEGKPEEETTIARFCHELRARQTLQVAG